MLNSFRFSMFKRFKNLTPSSSSSCIQFCNLKTNPQDPESVSKMDVYQFSQDKISSKRPKMVFGWGFAATGALGDEKYLSKYGKNGKIIEEPTKTMIRTPKKIRFTSSPKCDVYDVAAGSGFTVLAATYHQTSNIVFGCGLNTDSQLGFQANQNNEPLLCVGNLVPIQLPLDHIQSSTKIIEKVLRVACGRAHTVCITNLGNVFTMGNNSFGQCARPIVEDEKYFASRRIHQLNYDKTDPIVDAVCGLDHTLFLTKSGSIYACGWNNDGQLGNGSFESQYKLSKVIGDVEGERIVSLSCAADTVLAINDKGQIFGWGNSEYGQLGMVNSDKQINRSVHLNLENKFGKALDVAAAGSMCAMVNHDGIPYVWGYGILGLGPKCREKSEPTELSLIIFGKNALNPNIKVARIESGLHHFGAINSNGELFMWGKNNRANLGTGTKHDMMFPFRVSIPTFVTKISLGMDHTLAMGHKLV